MKMLGQRLSNSMMGVALVLVVLAWPATVGAQTTGTISGYVRDSSGAVVPQAKVTAAHVQHGTVYPTTTNNEGFYNYPALDPGDYTLTVEKEGFERTVQTGLTLTVSQNLR